MQRKLRFELLERRTLLSSSTTWTGGSGYWDVASNWSSGLPVAGSSVTINPTSAATITIKSTESYSIASLALGSSATLDLQLGGAPSSGKYGQLAISGAAALAGTLEADRLSSYSPSSSDAFVPISYGSYSGSFASYTLPSGSGYQFAAAVSFTSVLLSAAPTAAVTTTVNAGTSLHADANVLGVNTAYWDSYAVTSQTAQMTAAAGLDLYRYPGGSAADEFHFNVAENLGDPGAITISQFAHYVATAGATGMVTLDYGSGSPHEAAAEMAYLIGSTSDMTTIGTGIEWAYGASAWTNVNWGTVSYWAGLRAAKPLMQDDGLNFLRLNQSAPFSTINYWEIGNEEYGSWETDYHGTAGPNGGTGSPHDPETYATFAAQLAALATEIGGKSGVAVSIGIDSGDPTGGNDNNWTKNVLSDGKSLSFYPGFISDHNYVQEPGAENDATLLNQTVSETGSVLDWTTRCADYESDLQTELGAKAAGVQVMATEYNSVSYDPGKETTSLVNGLFVANALGSMLDSGYSAAYFWDLRNYYDNSYNDSNSLYGWRTSGDYGILGTDPSDPPASSAYIGYPDYYALQLISEIDVSGGEVVSTASSYGDLDVYAVLESDGDLELLVINTNPVTAISDQISVSGFQPASTVKSWQYGKSQDTAQSQSSNGASSLTAATAMVALSGATFSDSFPSYSMTVLDLKAAILTSVAISPLQAALSSTGTQQFTATALDQFGNAMAVQPALTWSVTGGGTVSTGGLYTAAYTTGTAVVTAASGGKQATVSVTLPGAASLSASGTTSWSSGAWTGSVSGNATSEPGLRGIGGDTAALAGSSGSAVDLNGVSPSLASIGLSGSVTIAPGSGGTLQLSDGSSSANISSSSGAPSISAPIVLQSNTIVTIASGATLKITGNISGTGESLTKTGAGVLYLEGTDTYSGGTVVSQGTLIFTLAASISSGTNLTVGSGMTMLLQQDETVPAAALAAATPSLVAAGGDDSAQAVLSYKLPAATGAEQRLAPRGIAASDGPVAAAVDAVFAGAAARVTPADSSASRSAAIRAGSPWSDGGPWSSGAAAVFGTSEATGPGSTDTERRERLGLAQLTSRELPALSE